MSTYNTYIARVAELKKLKPLFQQIEIEINLGCNRRCSYCFLATQKRENVVKARRHIMDWSLYCQLLSQLKDIDFRGEINFHFYAEPLLNKKLSSFIRQAKQVLNECTTVIYTNGDYLTQKKYEELKLSGLDKIYVTLHDNVMPEHLKSVLRHDDTALDSRGSMVIYNRAGYLGKSSAPEIKTLPCVYSALAVIVTIDGNVLPCSCDFNESMIFGNIKEQHLLDIWNNEKTKIFRSDLLEGRREKYDLCKNCDNYYDNLDVKSIAESHRSYHPDKSIKLLIFFPSLDHGGCEEYVKDVAKYAVELGWCVEVCFPQVSKTADLTKFFAQLDLPIHSWHLETRNDECEWGKWEEQRTKANELLNLITPEAVLIALPTPDSALGFISACGEQNRGGAAVFQLCTEHTPLTESQISNCKKAQEGGLQWVATSKFMVEYLTSTFRLDQTAINIVPNGRIWQQNIVKHQEPTRDKKYIAKAFGLPEDVITILTLARLTEQKGHKDILDIAPRIIHNFPNVRFIWAGSGEDKALLSSLIEQYKLQDYVLMVGNRYDVTELLHSANIFLLPSRWESTPLSITEAMLCDCPVIASDAGGIPELIDNQITGTLFPAGNQEALYEVLVNALNKPELLERMLIKAREVAIARNHFMKDSIIKILFENSLSR